MGKSHRDNHAARVKRGLSAFQKKADRREVDKIPCNICGTKTRPHKVSGGLCPLCLNNAELRAVAHMPSNDLLGGFIYV